MRTCLSGLISNRLICVHEKRRDDTTAHVPLASKDRYKGESQLLHTYKCTCESGCCSVRMQLPEGASQKRIVWSYPVKHATMRVTRRPAHWDDRPYRRSPAALGSSSSRLQERRQTLLFRKFRKKRLVR